MSFTKIVATIGPASQNVSTLSEMLRAGLSVARLNFSHGSIESNMDDLKSIKAAVAATGIGCAVLQDLCGPKIRIGDVEAGAITLVPGRHITLTPEKVLGTTEKMSISYPTLYKYVSRGSRILLNDGKNELRVIRIRNKDIITEIVVGGEIKGRRGVNVPGAHLPIASLTAKDKRDLSFGITHAVDYVALSFVRKAKDVEDLRAILKKAGSRAHIISKIETLEAVNCLEEIVAASDGVMVARGDLAVEVDPARVPIIQKKLITLCKNVGKPVIVATHMLESMITARTPTRAEVSDVANAVFDGTDAIMLSAESAIGKYPVESIAMMRSIASQVEQERGFDAAEHYTSNNSLPHIISDAAVKAAMRTRAIAIVAFTESGTTPRLISRARMPIPILSITPHKHTQAQLALSFACESHIARSICSTDEIIAQAKLCACTAVQARKGDAIVIVAGIPFGKQGSTNMLLVERM